MKREVIFDLQGAHFVENGVRIHSLSVRQFRLIFENNNSTELFDSIKEWVRYGKVVVRTF
jgi:hypothetical protein